MVSVVTKKNGGKGVVYENKMDKIKKMIMFITTTVANYVAILLQKTLHLVHDLKC